MATLTLTFESTTVAFSVRRFEIREALSEPFNVFVWAACASHDVDFETIIGRGAELAVETGFFFLTVTARSWVGVVERITHVDADPTGDSLYEIVIVPRLSLLEQRTNHRLFLHQSVPEIVTKLFDEWQIDRTWKLDRATYPKLDLRTQYGESDLAFVKRLLEEAGITFFFAPSAGRLADHHVVLADAPHTAAERGAPLPWIESPSDSGDIECATSLQLVRSLRPAKVVLRDDDFRRGPHKPITAESTPVKPASVEDRLEQYAYRPGHALVEMPIERAKEADKKLGTRPGGRGKPKAQGESKAGVVGGITGAGSGGAGEISARIAGQIAAGEIGDALVGDDLGAARHDQAHADAAAQRALEMHRVRSYDVQIATNALDVAPGVVLSMSDHPRWSMKGERLLCRASVLRGSTQGETRLRCRLVSAEMPYRPEMRTPKPVVHGVESAFVIGPKGKEIHVDEFGRVRAQLHWDREGQRDPRASCWMRVSQAWAGAGFGLFTIPRVGHEVLVAFIDGNPDLPIIVGRVHGGITPVPHVLPDHATRSTFRTQSSPGAGGNELMFDDATGRELVYLFAQRDQQQLVENDRSASIAGVDTTLVGERYHVQMAGSSTGIDMVDGRVSLDTGGARLVLSGDTILFEGAGDVVLHAKGGDVKIDGGPKIKLNCSGSLPSGGHAASSSGSSAPRAKKKKEQRPKPDGGRPIAERLRDNPRITWAKAHVSHKHDTATADDNIHDAATGDDVSRSAYKDGKRRGPGGTTDLNDGMLEAMEGLSEDYTFSVSEVAGGVHSNHSAHYSGDAFDVTRINGQPVSANNPYVRSFMDDCRAAGATTVLGPGDAGHSGHIHCGWPRR